MRRLPIYFVIDVSESMVGEPIEQVQEGIGTIIKELRTDPYALETAYISIVVFAGKAQKITPLVELYNFYPPKLPIGSGTSLGKAMDFLMSDIKSSIKKTTLDEKGDWKPIVFLFTDGNPTDNVDNAFNQWNEKFRRSTNLIAISLGSGTDTSILSRITENVLLLKDTTPESFKAFFKWITASIKTNSMSVAESNDDGLHLAPLTNDALIKIDPQNTSTNKLKVDESFAVLLGKCQNTKRHYLIKYHRRIQQTHIAEVAYNVMDYNLVGAFPIDSSYFDLAEGDPSMASSSINTQHLNGFPACPCCGNQYGFSTCACGKILCTGNNPENTCPWCNTKAKYDFGSGSMDIGRTQG